MYLSDFVLTSLPFPYSSRSWRFTRPWTAHHARPPTTSRVEPSAPHPALLPHATRLAGQGGCWAGTGEGAGDVSEPGEPAGRGPWQGKVSVELKMQGTHGTGKTGRMEKKNPCQGKHREFGNFVKAQGILSKHRENTGNFISSSCKCSDSKSKGYCDSCRKKILFFPDAG